MYHEFGKRTIRFEDDILVLDKQWQLEFCRELQKRELSDLQWHCNGRANLIDDDLLEAMAQSGCRGICYGIESGSDEVLRRIRKGFSRAVAGDAIRRTVKYMEAFVFYMWAFPFETVADFRQTVGMLIELTEWGKPVTITFDPLVPLPQSSMYHEFGDRVEISGRDFPRVDFLPLWESPEIEELVCTNFDILPQFGHYGSDAVTRMRDLVALFEDTKLRLLGRAFMGEPLACTPAAGEDEAVMQRWAGGTVRRAFPELG